MDIPGHPKVRGTAAQFFSSAKAVVFLVDAVDFMAQKTAVAEHLFEVGCKSRLKPMWASAKT